MLVLPAILTHELAAEFTLGLKKLVEAEPTSVVTDASALKVFDSSALAVLLACRREAIAAGKPFSVSGLPSRLQQLSRLYGVADLFPQAV
jgi:phospholipid transport system transporter-binding protein